jgi:hypothetical protein
MQEYWENKTMDRLFQAKPGREVACLLVGAVSSGTSSRAMEPESRQQEGARLENLAEPCIGAMSY